MASKEVKITILGDASSVQRAFGQGEKAAGGFESKLGQVGKVAAGVVSGGALLSMGRALLDGAKGATEDALALDKLKVAVENSGTSWDDYSGQVDAAIKKGQDLAFTDGETTAALQSLTEMTGSGEEAMKRLGLAQDLARAKGISLEEAAKLLGKTSDENTAALGRLGIRLGENATAQDVLNEVDKQFAGQAGTFAESDAGKMLKAQQASGELTEQLGTYLIPVIGLVSTTMLALTDIIATKIVPAVASFVGSISGILPIFQPVIDFFQNNSTPALVGLGAAITTIVIPALVLLAVAAAGAVAPFLPLIAIAAAVGVAVGALYLAWSTNFLGIQDITASVIVWLQANVLPVLESIWSGIQTGLAAVMTAWNTAWPVIQSIVETVFPIIAQVVTTYIGILKAEIELALAAVRLIWDTVFPAIQAVVETVFPIIVAVVTSGMSTLQTLIETGVTAAKWAFDNVFVPIQGVVSDVFNTITNIVSTIWGPAVTAIETGVNLAKSAFDIGFVPIQGVVKDVFDTIKSTINTLWNGAEGAVALIKSGLQAAKDAFDGVYETFKGYGSSIKDGLLAGMSGVAEAVGRIIDGIMDAYNKIPSFLRPGSPSRWAREQSKSLVDGLVIELERGLPRIAAAVGKVTATLATTGGATGSPLIGLGGSASAGGGSNVSGLSGSLPRHPAMATSIIAQTAWDARGMTGGVRGDDAFLSRLETLLARHAERVEQSIERGTQRALSGVM